MGYKGKKEKKKDTHVYERVTKETEEIINRIADSSSNNTFGYLDKGDLKGEIWVICLNALKDFKSDDGKNKLEHFLRVTVKNRLVNKFKDITKTVNSPCPKCPYYDPGQSVNDCGLFGELREDCDKWTAYQSTIKSRNALLNPTIEGVERKYLDNPINKLILDETKEKILEKLPNEFLTDFNTLLSGGALHKARQKKLQGAIFKCFEKEDLERIMENINF